MTAFDAAAYVRDALAAGCKFDVIVDRNGKRTLGTNIAHATDIPDAPPTIPSTKLPPVTPAEFVNDLLNLGAIGLRMQAALQASVGTGHEPGEGTGMRRLPA